MAILSLQNVSKEYTSDGQSVRALDGVTLEVAEGEKKSGLSFNPFKYCTR
jgi:hypothetical protein